MERCYSRSIAPASTRGGSSPRSHLPVNPIETRYLKMQLLTLLSPETKLSIFLGVILPTLIGLPLRWFLYRDLKAMNNRIARLTFAEQEEGIQPPIVNKLKVRYQEASKKIEQVNTTALIDIIYKDERLSYLGQKIQFDRAETITVTLPNLLIAFGLIGTFWGITSNLSNISAIIPTFNQSDSIVSRLEQPLQAMGVAFSTSLFGIFFGSILTIFNAVWNTSIAKYNLLAGLEDYLDNIYRPTVEGNTRLDKAVERMVQQQEEFLLRFHENVGRALETSFGRAAMQIADECAKINRIAEGVYTNFANAAGTISTGAATFGDAANSLKSQNQILANSLQEFKGGVEIFKIAANQIEQNNVIKNLDRILGELNTSQQEFANSTQTLEKSLVGITASNQAAAELAQNIYLTWQTSTQQINDAAETIGAGAVIFQQSSAALGTQTQIIVELMPQFKNGVNTFVTAANKVKGNNIIQNLDRVVNNLSGTQQAFADSAQILTNGAKDIITNNQQAAELAKQVYRGLDISGTQIQSGASSLVDAANSLATDLTTTVKSWQTAQTEFANSTTVFSNATRQIHPMIGSVDRAANNLQLFGNKIVDLSNNTLKVSQSTSAQIQPAIASIDRATNSLQQFGKEVVDLSNNTLKVSQSTSAQMQPAIDSIDRATNNLQQFGKEVVSLSNNTLKVSQSTSSQIQPAIASIDQAVINLQLFGHKIVDLSNNTLGISKSTQSAILYDEN
jgi:ribosomal 50S subunit-associated protein YjgA (DUF615 family)